MKERNINDVVALSAGDEAAQREEARRLLQACISAAGVAEDLSDDPGFESIVDCLAIAVNERHREELLDNVVETLHQVGRLPRCQRPFPG